MLYRYSRPVLVLAALVLISTMSAQDRLTIRYALWDVNQFLAYDDCAQAFERIRPDIHIELEHTSWEHYWTNIAAGFSEGTAPDVLTNHVAKYPAYVTAGHLVDLQPFVERDDVPTDIYYPGLAEQWTQAGKRYGMPKDWDTVAVIYNVELLKKAGIDPAIMDTWTWNLEDGGTFEQVIAALTIDERGSNALSPDFENDRVLQHGIVLSGSGGAYGQSEWSPFALSMGWTYNNGPWSSVYHYDDPRFIATVQWWADLILEHGYSPTYEEINTRTALELFWEGEMAMTIDGSWTIGDYLKSPFEVGFGRLPVGPQGRRSMFSGLADSIWIGTPHVEESWQWVKYLASEECQTIIGQSGTAFPAIPSATALTLKTYAEMGVDVRAFVEQAEDPTSTVLFPLDENAGDIADLMNPVMESIILGDAKAADVLPQVNADINALP